MGLVPHQESNRAQMAISWAKKIVLDNLQLKKIQEIANQAPYWNVPICHRDI
jgi:cobyrinic acid a,c-diamide synthase